MKKEDVPQQGGLGAGCREVNYATDVDGNYTLALSEGWEAKNVSLRQAWEVIIGQLQAELAEIKAGRRSALGYHMVKNQMDPTLLSQYSGIARWRVKRHLKPNVFAKLDTDVLEKYANLFGVSVAELKQVPVRPELELADLDKSQGEK